MQFVITKALYSKLYSAYRHKEQITCVRGKDGSPDSFFTPNIGFTLNGEKAIVKTKYGKNKWFTQQLLVYINEKHPTQLVG